MNIIALKFYTNGYMKESFALGGSAAPENINPDTIYPSSLQNYLIETGNEVILVDTGMPLEAPEMKRKEGQNIFVGDKVADFAQALQLAGYKPEDISKVILTHKHPDHAGELRMFPHASIYVSKIEAEAMKLQGDNIIPVTFKDGAYKNFAQSEIIAEGIRMIPAYGHTAGNSLVIVEEENLYYMLHGDITYTDEALRRNELSIVFEDKAAAKQTLEQVREFVKHQDTIYLSTHTPEGVTALENKVIMRL